MVFVLWLICGLVLGVVDFGYGVVFWLLGVLVCSGFGYGCGGDLRLISGWVLACFRSVRFPDLGVVAFTICGG